MEDGQKKENEGKEEEQDENKGRVGKRESCISTI